MPIFEGFLVGFAMILFVGPVLFTILQISLEKGILAGLMSALGVFISDLLCVMLCYYGTKSFINQIENSYWVSILGFIILFTIGIKYIVKPNLNTDISNENNSYSLLISFAKGFLVNFVNPFVFGVWIAVIGYAKHQYNAEIDVASYLLAATFAVLITDSLKVLFANYIRKILQPALLSKIYKVSGVILILFSVRILIHII